MNKFGDNEHNDEEYALEQLTNLKQDLSNMASEIVRKLEDVDQIICGLTKGHDWRLHEFTDLTYPCAEPPGVYMFKCTNCGEKIVLKACEKHIWGQYFGGKT